MRTASRLALYCAGCLLIGLVLLRVTSASALTAQLPVTTSLLDEPLAKFARLMPALNDPRCVNCHGVTDPFTRDPLARHPSMEEFDPNEARRVRDQFGDHDFRNVEASDRVCRECHNDPATTFWFLAPKRMSFLNETPRKICTTWQADKKDSGPDLMRHLIEDVLIKVAFKGSKGIVDNPPDPLEPILPMDRDKFLRLAEEWLKSGSGDIPCSGWVGTVTQVETISSTEIINRGATSGLRADGDVTEARAATRTMTITFNGLGGPAVTTISMNGAIRTEGSVTLRDAGGASCTLSTRSANVYTGQTTGDAEEATLTLASDGSYMLEITGPREASEARDAETTTHCTAGTMISESGNPESFEHPPWTVSIAAVLPDPRRRGELKGTITETVTDADPRLTSSWFLRRSQGLGGDYTKSDGTSAPVAVVVTTTWDLRRVQ